MTPSTTGTRLLPLGPSFGVPDLGSPAHQLSNFLNTVAIPAVTAQGCSESVVNALNELPGHRELLERSGITVGQNPLTLLQAMGNSSQYAVNLIQSEVKLADVLGVFERFGVETAALSHAATLRGIALAAAGVGGTHAALLTARGPLAPESSGAAIRTREQMLHTFERGERSLKIVAENAWNAKVADLKERLADKYVEPKNEVELGLELVWALAVPAKTDSVVLGELDRINALHQAVAVLDQVILQGLTQAVEDYTTNWDMIAAYHEARLVLGMDNLEQGIFHRPLSAYAIKAQEKKLTVAFVFAGQSNAWYEDLAFYYRVYPETRKTIEAGAERARQLYLENPQHPRNRPIEIMAWIRGEIPVPEAENLNCVEVSAEAIRILEKAELEVLRHRGFDPAKMDVKGATGHSQGVIPALELAGGLTDDEAGTDLYGMGVAYRRSHHPVSGKRPMLALGQVEGEITHSYAKVLGTTYGTLKQWVAEVEKALSCKLSVGRNTEFDFMVSGDPAALDALEQVFARETAEKGAKDVERTKDNAQKILFTRLPTEEAFHHPAHMAAGEEGLRAWDRKHGIRVNPRSLRFPVYESIKGDDLREAEDPLEVTIQGRSTNPWDFVKQTEPLQGVDLVICLGGRATANMVEKNTVGTGTHVEAADPKTYWSSLFTTRDDRVKQGVLYAQPTLVQLPDGTVLPHNYWLSSKRGRTDFPMKVGAMTPHTGQPEPVAAILKNGLITGTSSGSQGAFLDHNIQRIAELTGGDMFFEVNLIGVWGGLAQQIGETTKAREAGTDAGIELTAGLPGNIADIIRNYNKMGVAPTLKVGPEFEVRTLGKMLEQNPDLLGKFRVAVEMNPIDVVLEGAQAGGHHAQRVLSVQWAQSYDYLKSLGILVGAAGGIVTPEDVARYLTQGPAEGRRRPADFVVLGSTAQFFDVMNMTDSVREYAAKMTSADVRTTPSQAGAPQHVANNKYYEDVVALVQVQQEQQYVDKADNNKVKYKPLEKAQQVVLADRFRDSLKPYFFERNNQLIEPTQMTYRELLQRYVELMTHGEAGAWMPLYEHHYSRTLARMMAMVDRRLAGIHGQTDIFVDESLTVSDLKKRQMIDNPQAFVAAFLTRLGEAADRTLIEDDVELLSDIWDPGSLQNLDHFPLRFMFTLDPAKLIGHYKMGQTQFALGEDGKAPRLKLIQTGPQAADGIAKLGKPTISLADYHRESIEATVAAIRAQGDPVAIPEVSEPGAVPFQAVALDSLAGVEKVSETPTDSGGTERIFKVDIKALDAAQFWNGLKNQGTGRLRQMLDVGKVWNEMGVREDNMLGDVLSPEKGEQVRVRVDAAGKLESIAFLSAEGKETATVSLAGDEGVLTVIDREYGFDQPYRWRLKTENWRGLMPKVTVTPDDLYGSYHAMLQKSFPESTMVRDADGKVRLTFTITDEVQQLVLDAAGEYSEAAVRGDETGRKRVPPQAVARILAEPWMYAVFRPVPGGNPLRLLHTTQALAMTDPEACLHVGDTVTIEMEPLASFETDNGRVAKELGTVYLLEPQAEGEPVQKKILTTTSAVLTQGNFKAQSSEDRAGFSKDEGTLELKVDTRLKAETEAGIWNHGVHESRVTLNEGVTLKEDEVLQLVYQDVSTHTISPGIPSTRVIDSTTQGQLFRLSADGTREAIGTMVHTSQRAADKPHPLLTSQLMTKRTNISQPEVPFKNPVPVQIRQGKKMVTEFKWRSPHAGQVYANASGDFNPLHRNRRKARMAANPKDPNDPMRKGPINHGMETIAEGALKVLAQSTLADGDANRIRSYRVELKEKVPFDDNLTTKIEAIGARDGLIIARVTVSHKAEIAGAMMDVPVLVMTAEVEQPVTAYLFPGQGDQKPGMFAELLKDEVGKASLDRADKSLHRQFGFHILQLDATAKMPELHFDPVPGSNVRRLPIKHPNHVIDRTEMSQVTLMAAYIANIDILRARGLLPKDPAKVREALSRHAIFGGNSLGEYAVSYALGLISAEDCLVMVYKRGLTMQAFVEPMRDATGESPFQMDVVLKIKNDEVRRLVAKFREVENQFVVAANMNSPAQTTITGPRVSVDAAGKFIVAESKGKASVARLPIDTPFHSHILAFGLPRFYRDLDGIMSRMKVVPEAIARHYVVDITGEVWEMTPQYAESLLRFVEGFEKEITSDAFQKAEQLLTNAGLETGPMKVELKELLASIKGRLGRIMDELVLGTGDRTEMARFLNIVGFAFNFTSPMEWVKVQQQIFDPKGKIRATRLVELGVGVTLKELAERTLPEVFGLQSVLVSGGKGWKLQSMGDAKERAEILWEAVPEVVAEVKPVVAKPAVASPAAVPVATVTVQPVASTGAAHTQPIPDVAFTAIDAIVGIIAIGTKVRPEAVDVSKNLTQIITASGIRTGVRDPIKAEVGLEDVEGSPLSEVASQAKWTKPGKSLTGQYSREVASKLTGTWGTENKSFASLDNMLAYLEYQWPTLGAGRRMRVALEMMLVSLDATLGQADLVLSSSRNGQEWADAVVRWHAGKEKFGISNREEIEAAKAAGGGGGGVDPKVIDEKVDANNDRIVGALAAELLGPDYTPDSVRALKRQVAEQEAALAALQQKLSDPESDPVVDLLGKNFRASLVPVFDAKKIREIDSLFTDVQMIEWLEERRREYVAGIRTNSRLEGEALEELDRILNRPTARLKPLLAHLMADTRAHPTRYADDVEIGEVRHIAGLYRRLLSDVQKRLAAEVGDDIKSFRPLSRPDRVYRFTRPTLRIAPNGDKVVTEVPDPRSAKQIMAELKKGGKDPKTGERFPYLTGKHINLVTDAIADTIDNGISYTHPVEGGGTVPQVALMVGPSSKTINSRNLKAFLAGGGHAIVTVSSADYNEVRDTELGRMSIMEYYNKLIDLYPGTGARVTVLNMNKGSEQDIRKAIKALYDRNVRIDHIFDFGAWPLAKDAHTMTTAATASGDGLAHYNVNMIGMKTIAGAIFGELEARGIEMKVNLVIPGSPNKGLMEGDDEYGAIQAAKVAFVNRWYSDTLMHKHSRVIYGMIGWGRGTNLMGQNDAAAVKVEEDTGIRTFNQDESSMLLMAGIHPTVLAAAETETIDFAFGGGFEHQGRGIDATFKKAGAAVEGVSVLNKLTHTEIELDLKAQGGESAAPKVLESSGYFEAPQRGPAIRTVSYDKSRIHIDPSKVLVVVAADTFGAGGDRETQFALRFDLTDESMMGVLDLMGRVRYKGGRYFEVNHETGENGNEISPAQAKKKYEGWVRENTFVREIKPGAKKDYFGDFDPKATVRLMHMNVPYVIVEDSQLSTVRRPGDRVFSMSGGRSRLERDGGFNSYVETTGELGRIHAGLIPTGWNPINDGFPKDWIDSKDPATLYIMRSVMGAVNAMGLEPEELMRKFGPRLGLSIGAGMGPMNFMQQLFLNALFGKPSRNNQGPDIVEGLLNMPTAWVAMALFPHFFGPKYVNVAACGTNAEAMLVGMQSILSGETDVMITGATDAPVGPAGIDRFEEIKATAGSADLQAIGVPLEDSAALVLDAKRAGFNLGEGANAQVLTRLDIALREGWDILAEVVQIGNASGGGTRNAPAPDRGALVGMPRIWHEAEQRGLTARDVKLKALHGTATYQGDKNETGMMDEATQGRDAGILDHYITSKADQGHKTGPAFGDLLLDVIEAFRTGWINGRRGLQSIDPIIAGLMHTAINRNPMQLNPQELTAALIGSFGFGKENFTAMVANPSERLPRMVPRDELLAWQRKRDANRDKQERTYQAIRTGARPRVLMNDGQDSPRKAMEDALRKNQDHYARVVAGMSGKLP